MWLSIAAKLVPGIIKTGMSIASNRRRTKELESVTYYENYVIVNSGKSDLEVGELIDEDDYIDLEDQFGIESASEEEKDNDEYFKAYMGGRGILELLKNLDQI